jgi:hypothetical protein
VEWGVLNPFQNRAYHWKNVIRLVVKIQAGNHDLIFELLEPSPD